MIPQLNPLRSVQKSKPKMILLFIGRESDSGSSHLTRPSQLATPPSQLKRARLATVGSSSWGRRLPRAAPTWSRVDRRMKIGRLGVVVLLSLARRCAMTGLACAAAWASSHPLHGWPTGLSPARIKCIPCGRPCKSAAHLLPSTRVDTAAAGASEAR